MRKIKVISLLCILIATGVLLSGCVGLGDIIFGLQGKGASSAASSSLPKVPAISSSSKAQVSSSSSEVIASIASSIEASKPEEKPSLLNLNKEAAALLGKTNAAVRAANGGTCNTYIMYGGNPVADYVLESVSYPFSYWLEANQGEWSAVWNENSDGMGNVPKENFWPDNYTVGTVEAWGDAVPRLFGSSSPVSYSLLKEVYGQSPELEFNSASEGEINEYIVDTWTTSYEIDGYSMFATFEEKNGEYVMFLARLS